MDEAQILALAKEKAALFDSEIEEVFAGDIPNLHDAIRYHIAEPGKRLRPLLAFLTCEALGGNAQRVVPFAAACDVLQHWILIHDDIEDGDTVRRGQAAVWVKYGIAHGVNVGDYMSHKVYELILRSKRYGVSDAITQKLLEAMVEAVVRTAEGQAMDINLRGSSNPTEEEYMRMVVGKTAHYMTVPMVGGAIVAGRDDLLQKLIEYGQAVGPAFQITDDLLDLTEGKGRGETGRDIKEGKRSLLVVHCLQNCEPHEREKLLDILNKPVEKTTHEDVLLAKSLFEKHGSVDYAKRRAKECGEEARRIAKQFPPRLAEILIYVADYMEQRKK